MKTRQSAPAIKKTERKLNLLAGKLAKLLALRNAAFDVILLPHDEIKKLKARFIKKRTEPNVLAFREPAAFPHPETKKKYIGEIYLNREILDRSPERAAPLLVHGMLHLLGHDHKRKAETEAMEKLERKILEQLH